MNGIARFAPSSEETGIVSQPLSAIESILAEEIWRDSGTYWAIHGECSVDALSS